MSVGRLTRPPTLLRSQGCCRVRGWPPASVTFVRDLGRNPRLDLAALRTEIHSKQLNRVVIAGELAGYFKAAFTRAMVEAGGDPAEVRLASYREHGAAFGEGTERAKGITACAVLGVPYGLAAVPETTSVNPDTLVIGGGVAGIQVALEIADAGKKV